MSNISPYLAFLEISKDQKTQAIVNAFRLLSLDVSQMKSSAATGTTSSGDPTALFQFAEIPYATTITPTYPANARFYATRVAMTGNISGFTTPFNIRTGAAYAAIFETDSSSRTVTFSAWYSFLGSSTVTIPANSRYCVFMVCTNEGSQGRQISASLQSTGGGGSTGWVGPTIVPPTTAGTWTPVNGISVSDGTQSTIILSKASSGLGLAMKALGAGAYDVAIGISAINFGSLTSGSSALPSAGLFVSTGTNTAASVASGVIAYHYGAAAPTKGIVTRVYSPISSGAPTAISSYNIAGLGLNVGAVSWFRITGTTGSGYTLYAGDGIVWDFIVSGVGAISHFGIGIDPTTGIGAASPQVIRVVSSSL